jgi:hypothetical protein
MLQHNGGLCLVLTHQTYRSSRCGLCLNVVHQVDVNGIGVPFLIHTKVRNKLSYKKNTEVGVCQLQPMHSLEVSWVVQERRIFILETNGAFIV